MAGFKMTRRQGVVGALAGMFGFGARPALAATSYPAGSIGASMPADLRDAVKTVRKDGNHLGLYFSRKFEFCRVIALLPGNRYALAIWYLNPDDAKPWTAPRLYKGQYSQENTAYDDTMLILDIGYQDVANGGDVNDEALVIMRSGDTRYLVRRDDFDHIAFDIRENATLGDSEAYLFGVGLDDPLPEEPYEGRGAPPLSDLPNELRELVTAAPIRATIIQVDEIGEPEPFAENRQVMCTLDKGSDDGLYKNMPLFSPAGSDRGLEGWVWDMEAKNCRAGIRYSVGADGKIAKAPKVGDVLTNHKSYAAE